MLTLRHTWDFQVEILSRQSLTWVNCLVLPVTSQWLNAVSPFPDSASLSSLSAAVDAVSHSSRKQEIFFSFDFCSKHSPLTLFFLWFVSLCLTLIYLRFSEGLPPSLSLLIYVLSFFASSLTVLPFQEFQMGSYMNKSQISIPSPNFPQTRFLYLDFPQVV